jgi:SAM-dependent methyltransferase
MPDVTEHTRKYWRYEYDVATRYMVPLLERWGVRVRGCSVIDVGCGEGGGLCALYDQGARSSGFDIDWHRVEAAESMKDGRDIRFVTGDIYNESLPFTGTRYDLVVLHDVFEHLEEKERMMARLKGLVGRGGKVLITFPPYFSAFGAHQQHLSAPFARLPFFHLVPFALSRLLPRMTSEDPSIVQEVQKLGRLRMGMRAFERIARSSGMKVERKQAYLISPNHIRFGLHPVAAGPVAEIPLVGEVVCTGVVYLLSPQ